MTHLTLPTRCLTLLPPWPQAIRYAEKRLENRSGSVAKPLAEWRYGLGLENVPIVGLSQSKQFARRFEHDEALCQADRIIKQHGADTKTRVWAPTAGTLWLCAELLDVLPPDKCEGDPWHVPDQWGLILGRVWEVKPVPCTGGQGAWTASSWCVVCKHVYADSAKPTSRCYTCKAPFPANQMTEKTRAVLAQSYPGEPRPQLEIITEVS
jgi:hypothetical protein